MEITVDNLNAFHRLSLLSLGEKCDEAPTSLKRYFDVQCVHCLYKNELCMNARKALRGSKNFWFLLSVRKIRNKYK